MPTIARVNLQRRSRPGISFATIFSGISTKENQIELLHGGLPDTKQQQIVDDFGQESKSVRILLASDVASEGLNLHFRCHKLVHFDVPWSLMVFAQRNGRIDRDGQEQPPQIVYLLTDAKNEKIRGDMRILELLSERQHQARRILATRRP